MKIENCSFMTGFVCIRCGQAQDQDFRGYCCTACGANLEVTYDYDRLRSELATGSLLLSQREDIFRYLRLLPLQGLEHIPKVRVGNTPLYHATQLADHLGLHNVYLKDDGLNPSGSFKDRASAVAIARACEMGADVVAAASTGNAGSSMACMAASMGKPAVVFLPESAPPAKVAQLLVFGAHIIAVKGTYDDAFDLCSAICEKRGWFNRNTGFNPYTREGKKTCSFEICEQRQWNAPDSIIVCTGDGNIISGIWKGLRDLHAIGLIDHLPRVIAAQAEGSAAVTRAVHRLRKEGFSPERSAWTDVTIEPVQANTLADSISVDDPRDGLAAVRSVLESKGDAVTVSDADILDALAELGRLTGVFAEPSAAASYAALRKLAAAGTVAPNEHVVCLISGSGLKDIDGARKAVGKPVVIPPDIAEAERALNEMGVG